jgi:hypothetical protein
LLDDNAVLGDAGESDILVGNVRDVPRGVIDGLNSHTILGVLDGGRRDGDGLDGVVGAAADGAYRKTVPSRTSSACEGNGSTGVYGEAVVLVDTATC